MKRHYFRRFCLASKMSRMTCCSIRVAVGNSAPVVIGILRPRAMAANRSTNLGVCTRERRLYSVVRTERILRSAALSAEVTSLFLISSRSAPDLSAWTCTHRRIASGVGFALRTAGMGVSPATFVFDCVFPLGFMLFSGDTHNVFKYLIRARRLLFDGQDDKACSRERIRQESGPGRTQIQPPIRPFVACGAGTRA